MEEITDENLLEDQARAGAVDPLDLRGARSPWRRAGAWPVGLVDHYAAGRRGDRRAMPAAARTPEGFASYLSAWLDERKAA